MTELPGKFTALRPHQATAITQIVDAFARVKCVVLDAPTGSGKSLIGEMVRRELETRAVYLCTSKQLQHQLAGDFGHAKVLKGRDNYATLDGGEGVTCDDCDWNLEDGCSWCSSRGSCPYQVAKGEALAADLAILNTSYFLHEVNHVGRFSGQKLVVVDEADELEEQLMKHVSVEIGERRLARWGWDAVGKVTVQETWGEWLDEKIPKLAGMAAKVGQRRGDLASVREAKYLSRLLSSMRQVRAGLDSGTWAYTGRGVRDEPGRGVSFRPVFVDGVGEGHLWRHAEKWLLMSATVISSEELVRECGWAGEFETIQLDSTFDARNRPVHVRPAATMSRERFEEGVEGMVAAVKDILAQHPNERVLVHTVSYDLTRRLLEALEHLERPVGAYMTALDRERALEAFRDHPASVLLAPSFHRGVDLPDEQCRVVVVAKVPFPYLGDRQVSARLHGQGGQRWYTVQTVRRVVQMCGRGVRHEDDYCTTYILDSQFGRRLWNDGRSLFPKWFRDALIWERT